MVGQYGGGVSFGLIRILKIRFIIRKTYKMKFKELAISNHKELYFGTAPHPVKTPRGLIIGGVRSIRN